jgi:aldose 1-epimerase
MLAPAMSEANVTTVDGLETVILRDGNAEAHVVSGLGANVARFRVGDVEVLASPPDMATLRERPTRWGSACLFPFPGRIQGGRFTFRGKTIQLPVDGRDGNAIHGVVRTRPWRVLSADAAKVRARISTAAAGIPAAEWPWPFELTLTVTLNDGRLRVATEARNVGSEAMPIGLGFHPYFHVDDKTLVQIDATEEWAQEAGLPTGQVRQLTAREWPRKALPIGQIPPDSQMAEGPVRNRLVRKAGTGRAGVRATLTYPTHRVALSANAGFRRMVFFTPASPPLVSLEPQTCVPNAHRLAGEGNDETGLVVLVPGRSWRGWWELRVEPSL